MNGIKDILKKFLIAISDSRLIAILTILSFIIGNILLLLNRYAIISTLLIIVSVFLFALLVYSYWYFRKNRIPIIRRSFFVNVYLPHYIQKSEKNIKIVCIFFSWWEKIKNLIFEKMEKNSKFKFEIYFIKRKRLPEDISYLKLREMDEHKIGDFVKGMNRNLFDIFSELLKRHSSKKVNIQNFEVKEYEFMPCLCIYIFDNKKLIYGPYIAKSCEDIPLTEITAGEDDSPKDPHNDVESAFNEIKEHFRYISGRERRINKDYPRRFSFFDGTYNIPIHAIIEMNTEKLRELTIEMKTKKYDAYLNGESEEYSDDILYKLGNDRDEGRFDSLMRYIFSELFPNIVVYEQKWKEEIEVIMGMVVQSVNFILKNQDVPRNTLRLTECVKKIDLITTHLSRNITLEWKSSLEELKNFTKAFISNPSQNNVTPILDIRNKIIGIIETEIIQQ